MISAERIITLHYRCETGGYQPFLEVWSVPSHPTAAPTLLATYLFPFFQESADFPLNLRFNFLRNGAQRHCFKAPCYTILKITLENHELFVPLSTFVGPHTTASMPHVEHPWAEWGPRSTCLFHSVASVAGCGNHVLLTDEILDFNPRILDVNTPSLHPSRYQCTMNSLNCAE